MSLLKREKKFNNCKQMLLLTVDTVHYRTQGIANSRDITFWYTRKIGGVHSLSTKLLRLVTLNQETISKNLEQLNKCKAFSINTIY